MTPQEAVKTLQDAKLICRYCDLSELIYGGGYRDKYSSINFIKDGFIIEQNDFGYEVFFEKDNGSNSIYYKDKKVVNVPTLEKAVSLVLKTIIPRDDIEAPKHNCDGEVYY